MFVVTQTDSYLWPVKISTPVDGGTWDNQTFDARLKRLTQTRIGEAKAQAVEGKIPDATFVQEILVGWEGINDAQGQPVPFSETTRDRLLDVPGFSGAVINAFFASLAGAPRKN